MKIETLILERYGAFEDAAFDFSGDFGFHLVYGPNEAGKSTVLAAIGDLLFGIPGRTPFNFRHEYSRLRIGARIVNAAGKRLEFKRRKANASTLMTLGSSEAALPDNVLTPFLGGADRELFTRMFGLDHERLRDGGRRMLQADGDLARSLFEASSGLSGLAEVISTLEVQIEAIGDLNRRANKAKPIWRDVEAFVAAHQSVRRDGLRPDEWRQAEEDLNTARGKRERLDQELVQRRQRRARLERIRRVAPLLAAIDDLSLRLNPLAGIPAFAPGFAEDWRKREIALRDARVAVEGAGEALMRLTADVRDAPEPGPFLRFADDINNLSEDLGRYRRGLADTPKLTRDLAGDDALIADHLRSLGLSHTPDGLMERVPPSTLVARIRELIRRGEALRTGVGTATDELQAARANEADARHAIEALPAPTRDVMGASALFDEIARLGDLADQFAKAERDLTNATEEFAEALKRLGGWHGSADALAATPFPDIDTVNEHDEVLRDLRERLERAGHALREATDEAQRVEGEITALTAVGEVPSPAAVDRARDHRDRGWQLVRARHIEGREVAPEELGAFGNSDLPSEYEHAVRHADELVDRRGTEAQRVARYAELLGQQHRLRGQQQVAVAQRADATSAMHAAETAWVDLWVSSGVEPKTPGAMRAWLPQKDEVLRRLKTLRRTKEVSAEVAARRQRAHQQLHAAAELLGVPVAESVSLEQLQHDVRRSLAIAQKSATARETAETKLDDARKRLQEKQKAWEDAGAALATWAHEWAEAIVRLELAPNASGIEAETALGEWEEIRQLLKSRGVIARRLDGLSRDIHAFEADLAAMIQKLGPAGQVFATEADPEGAVRALVQKLNEAKTNASRRAELEARHERAVLAVQNTEAALQSAIRDCDQVREAYGLSEFDDVVLLAEQAEERRRLKSELDLRRGALAQASDGLNEADLRSEVETTSSDAAMAELAVLEGEEKRVVEESQVAAGDEARAQLALKDLEGRKSVVEAAQLARNAAQSVAAHVERWFRFTAAKAVLERALELYRAENQHPLVQGAGEIFTAMVARSENPIIRLDVTYGDGSEPALIGVRRDGTECRVEGMSEGTRDQLFLSLRVAAVEQYVGNNEPLPFIADDLFITTDDERVVPGLSALAELGRSTQVILFTHHQYVLAAASALPPGTVKVHRLPIEQASERLHAMAS